MSKIDVTEWKGFRVGDLFNVQYGKFIAAKDSVDSDNGYPHITTTQMNNGIAYYVKAPMFDGNCITVASDGCQGMSFYQDSPFSASNIVSVLIPFPHVPLNRYNANFICALLRAEGKKYSWGGFKFSVERVRETILKLPVTEDGLPDFKYMETYMRALEEKTSSSLTALQSAQTSKNKKLDVHDWKKFHLYDIFEISMGNKFDKSKMQQINPTVSFVGRSGINNGVACEVDLVKDKNGEYVQPYKAGDMTIAMGGSVGSTFVQEKDFYTSQNVCVLHTDNPSITSNVKHFIAAVIMASCSGYEAFVEELNKHIRTDFTIRLPVDSDGHPDWDYMDKYIAHLSAKTINAINALTNTSQSKTASCIPVGFVVENGAAHEQRQTSASTAGYDAIKNYNDSD